MTDSTLADQEDLQLRLERLEAKVVTGLFEHPGVVSRAMEHQLRYAVRLAALDTFQPGAAIKGGRNQRVDVRVRSPRLRRWRLSVLDGMAEILLGQKDSRVRVEESALFLQSKGLQLVQARDEVLDKYAGDFTERELDQEIGIKTLVNVAGGGGGSGYVYLGAWELLQNAGLVPGYVIGASIGSVLGLFRALRKDGDWDEYAGFAKSMRAEDVFRYVSLRTRYGLPGISRLFLHAALGSVFRNEAGAELMLSDLEIPFDTVVAGLRRDATTETAAEYAQSHHLPLDKRPGSLQLRAQIVTQLVRMVGFINPRVVREIVIGSDELTRDFNAIDAAGFSAAIPGILHYDVTRDDPHMDAILTQLMEREDVTALVDGGVANNVPARSAWNQVRSGKIGTRNSYILAFDCFHPQLSFGHIWMQPLTRAVAYQVALNQRYAQRRIKFQPTLSPINLLPPPDQLDQAVAWGRQQMSEELPQIQKFFERVRWVRPQG